MLAAPVKIVGAWESFDRYMHLVGCIAGSPLLVPTDPAPAPLTEIRLHRLDRSMGTCVIGPHCASCRLADISCRPIGARDLALTDLADLCYMINRAAGP